jgi:hypoxanthine phosphoribosyltransferase
LRQDIEYILFDEQQLARRVAQLGAEISQAYEGKNPLIIGILKGSFIFMADLMRAVTIPCTIEFMGLSSYGSGTSTSGTVQVSKDLTVDVENRHLLVVEDILDSGVTLSYLVDYLSRRNPASVEIAALLDKPSRRQKPVLPKYTGFTVADEFLVGYGLDYSEKYRNLPYIGVLKREVYENNTQDMAGRNAEVKDKE